MMPRRVLKSKKENQPQRERAHKFPRLIQSLVGRRKGSQEHQDEEENLEKFNLSECKRWFQSYCDSSSSTGNGKTGGGGSCAGVIYEGGIEKLAKDIGKDLEDIVFLVLAWKMDAKNMGQFTEDEWLIAMSDLKTDSSKKLLSKWNFLRSLLDDQTIFRSVYRFSYDFARDKESRHLDVDVSSALISLFLGDSWPLCNEFVEFLTTSGVKAMNKDQYNNVLEFQLQVKDDLSDYDYEGAWPVLLDDFVIHSTSKRQTPEVNSMDCSTTD